MTREWSELEALPDFTTISLTTVILLFAAFIAPFKGYGFTTFGSLFELFGVTWLTALVVYFLLTKWEAVQHALVDNIVATTVGFVLGSWIYYMAFGNGPSSVWVGGFLTTLVMAAVISTVFVAFFQVVTRRLGD